MDKKYLGENIKKLRSQKGKTQKEMAKDLGVSTSTIGMLETGKRDTSLEFLIKLSNYLGVSTDYLLGNVDKDKDLMADSIIQTLIDAGEIEEGEELTDEKRKRIMNIIDTAIKLSRM